VTGSMRTCQGVQRRRSQRPHDDSNPKFNPDPHPPARLQRVHARHLGRRRRLGERGRGHIHAEVVRLAVGLRAAGGCFSRARGGPMANAPKQGST
jgi:hypothetical protein